MTATVAQQQVWPSEVGDSHEKSTNDLTLFTLSSPEMKVRLTDYGARLVSIETPDRHGMYGDVLLGYDAPQLYLADTRTHLGATLGRYANRIANGIFMLDGTTFHTDLNRDRTTLHGGSRGFDKLMWHGSIIDSGVHFSLVSPDGDMGFPGNLEVSVRYTLTARTLRIDYSAQSDRDTIINLSNHAYFNLGGDACASIEDHMLLLQADNFTPVNEVMIPTGEIAPVMDSPFDFMRLKRIGEHIDASHRQLQISHGYDHNFVLRKRAGALEKAAFLSESISGRTMTIHTTEPGIQFYSGNLLDGTFIGRHGIPHTKRRALCLEPQHFPDSPNNPSFPTTRLDRGAIFRSTTTYCFACE